LTAETLELLKEAFGDIAFGKNAICKWYAKFKGGQGICSR
jgi:hypothetical protein